MKAAGVSATFAATVFKPKLPRAPQSGDMRQAQGSYAQAERVAQDSHAKAETHITEAARGSSRPGGALNLKA